MTYRTDPFIPQQAETVAEVVSKTMGGRWGPQHQVRDLSGVWHRISRRAQHAETGLRTTCRRVIPVAHAVTRISADRPTCERCAR